MESGIDCVNQMLVRILREGDCCIAFSAGVDSTVVLKLACLQAEKLGRTVYAVTFQTMLHPMADMKLALRLAQEYGAQAEILQVDEYEIPQIMNNPPDRCFYCKDYLFRSLARFAESRGCVSVLDGTNADDRNVFRPGLKALQKNHVVSPLAECGITKEQVRQWAAAMKLETASRPSTPCLATRLPYGVRLDKQLLKRIEAGEQYLEKLGVSTCRLRVHGDVVRIEVDPKDFLLIHTCREELIQYLKKLGFSYITLDLQGLRSGSMDETLPEEVRKIYMN